MTEISVIKKAVFLQEYLPKALFLKNLPKRGAT